VIGRVDSDTERVRPRIGQRERFSHRGGAGLPSSEIVSAGTFHKDIENVAFWCSPGRRSNHLYAGVCTCDARRDPEEAIHLVVVHDTFELQQPRRKPPDLIVDRPHTREDVAPEEGRRGCRVTAGTDQDLNVVIHSSIAVRERQRERPAARHAEAFLVEGDVVSGERGWGAWRARRIDERSGSCRSGRLGCFRNGGRTSEETSKQRGGRSRERGAFTL